MNVHSLGDIAKYREFDVENGVEFAATDRRTFRLFVNCQSPTAFYAHLGPSLYRFLALVQGHHEISFVVNGPVAIHAQPSGDGPVWYWSPEFESFSVEMPDAETFTTITERRARNPELDRMMSKMMGNMDRRFADLEYSLDLARQAEAQEKQRADALAAAAEKKNAKKRAPSKVSGNAGAGDGAAGETLTADPPGGDESGGDDAGGNE